MPGTRWLGALWFRQTRKGGGWLFSASATRSRVVVFVDTMSMCGVRETEKGQMPVPGKASPLLLKTTRPRSRAM